MWHSGEHKTVTLDRVNQKTQDKNIKAVFQALNLSGATTETPADLSIAALPSKRPYKTGSTSPIVAVMIHALEIFVRKKPHLDLKLSQI